MVTMHSILLYASNSLTLHVYLLPTLVYTTLYALRYAMPVYAQPNSMFMLNSAMFMMLLHDVRRVQVQMTSHQHSSWFDSRSRIFTYLLYNIFYINSLFSWVTDCQCSTGSASGPTPVSPDQSHSVSLRATD